MSDTTALLESFIKEALLNEARKKRKAKQRKRSQPKRKKPRKKSQPLSAKTNATLKEKAKKANMPKGALTAVYRKGLAAWLTGHRQGVAQHQWAMGRVNSFIRGGKTRQVDKAEWEMVKKFRSKKKNK